jgi:phosphonate transport system permease protein
VTVTQAPEGTPKRTAPEGDRARLRPPWPWRKQVLAATLAAVAVATAYSFERTGFSPLAVIDGLEDMRRLIERMLPVRFDDLDRTIELAIETFFIAYLGTALAVVLSTPLAFMAARNTTVNRFAFGAARGVIVAMRAIPDLVFALIFVRAIGIGGVGGTVAGILAIGLNSVGMIGKLYADAIEQIDEGQREAVLSTGAGKGQALVTGVVPQVLPSFIGVALYRLDINFRTSTILGYVGAGGIGQLLHLYLSGLRYDRALGVTAVIVVLVLVVEFTSAAVRKSILGGIDPFEDRRLTRRIASAGQRVSARVVGAGRTAAAPAVAAADAAQPFAFDEGTLRPPWTRQRRRMAAYSALGLVLLVGSFVSTGVTPVDLVVSLGDIWQVAQRLVPNDLAWLSGDLRSAMVETIAIGLAASATGLALSLPLAYLAARNVAPARWVYVASRSMVVLVRAVPELILAVLFVAALGLGPFPGVLALAIGTLGFATKLFADAIEEVDRGPRDAVVAVGSTRLQEAVTGVTPQFMPSMINTSLYVLDINIRASTILGIVGAGGVGFHLIQATRTLDWETVGGILVMIFVVVYAIERLSGWVRKQLI